MNILFRTAYTLGLKLYCLGAHILAMTGHDKADQWLRGQRSWRSALATTGGERVIWMHCASLGEFEQGRPVLDALQKRLPDHRFVISFFSPSGYEQIARDSHEFELVYLPLDTRKNASEFIEILNPRLAFFVKYEFWINYLSLLKRRGIPVFLISALISKKHLEYPVYSQYVLECLEKFNHIFVQNRESMERLQKVDIPSDLAGDTRIDRVLSLPEEAEKMDFPGIVDWIGGREVLICGSSWPADEKVIFSCLRSNDWSNLAVMVAPHDVSENHIHWMQEQCPCRSSRYSKIGTDSVIPDEHVLIIDSVGLLSRLYKLADIAYVGGAFKSGLHNILEPATFQIPLIFGPEYSSFPEAVALVKRKAARSISTASELAQTIEKFRKPRIRDEIKVEISAYLQEQQGATEQIMKYLEHEGYMA